MFWGFLRIFENPVLGSKTRFSAQMSNNAKKYFGTLRKHLLNTIWGILRIFWNPILGWKIRFSAQMSNNAKNTTKLSENTN